MSKKGNARTPRRSFDAVWRDRTESAFRAEQERLADVCYSRRMEMLDRAAKFGIKLGAVFHGQIIGRKKDPRLEDDYKVVKIDKAKGEVFLRGRKDEKTRRVTFLNRIFGPRAPRRSMERYKYTAE